LLTLIYRDRRKKRKKKNDFWKKGGSIGDSYILGEELFSSHVYRASGDARRDFMADYIRFLSIDEACAMLHLRKSYVYKLINEHRLPYFKPLGGRILFDQAELESFVRKSRISTNAELSSEADAIINSRKHRLPMEV